MQTLFSHEPLGECVCKENTSDEWDILRYTTRTSCITILYHVMGNTWHYIIDAVHDGKVRWNTDEYTTVFSHSDWLYFLWRCINGSILQHFRERPRFKNLLNFFFPGRFRPLSMYCFS